MVKIFIEKENIQLAISTVGVSKYVVSSRVGFCLILLYCGNAFSSSKNLVDLCAQIYQNNNDSLVDDSLGSTKETKYVLRFRQQ